MFSECGVLRIGEKTGLKKSYFDKIARLFSFSPRYAFSHSHHTNTSQNHPNHLEDCFKPPFSLPFFFSLSFILTPSLPHSHFPSLIHSHFFSSVLTLFSSLSLLDHFPPFPLILSLLFSLSLIQPHSFPFITL